MCFCFIGAAVFLGLLRCCYLSHSLKRILAFGRGLCTAVFIRRKKIALHVVTAFSLLLFVFFSFLRDIIDNGGVERRRALLWALLFLFLLFDVVADTGSLV